MDEIKINFGQLTALEKSLKVDDSGISANALQDMVNIIINTPRNEVKNTVAYRTLLDLGILTVISEAKTYDKPAQLNS